MMMFKNMTDLEDSFLKATHHWIQDEPYCVAVSGGMDSMVLLHIMSIHFSNIVVFTFDHGLRDDTHKDLALVQSFCDEKGIDMHSAKWVSPSRKRLHEHARVARYQAMKDFCTHRQCKFLLTAHHLDDQMETIMMRFFKGSGPMGLRGMTPFQKLSPNLTLLRPFLDIPQSIIFEYAQKYSIPYIIDPSNTHQKFWRGQYRYHKDIFISLGLKYEHILHMRRQMIEMTDFIREQVQEAEHRIVTTSEDGHSFEYKKFIELPTVIQRKLMQKIIQDTSGFTYPPSYVFIQKLVEKMTSSDLFKPMTIQTCWIFKKNHIFKVSVSKSDQRRRQKQILS